MCDHSESKRETRVIRLGWLCRCGALVKDRP